MGTRHAGGREEWRDQTPLGRQASGGAAALLSPQPWLPDLCPRSKLFVHVAGCCCCLHTTGSSTKSIQKTINDARVRRLHATTIERTDPPHHRGVEYEPEPACKQTPTSTPKPHGSHPDETTELGTHLHLVLLPGSCHAGGSATCAILRTSGPALSWWHSSNTGR